MLTAEQLLAAHKANLDTMFSLGAKAFEGVEKLVELNIQTAKTTMEEAAEHAKAVLSAKPAGVRVIPIGVAASPSAPGTGRSSGS